MSGGSPAAADHGGGRVDGFAVEALPRRRLRRAADFLFEVHRDELAFQELFGARSADELEPTRAIFHGLVAATGGVPGLALGCRDGSSLIGATVFAPILPDVIRARRRRAPWSWSLDWLYAWGLHWVHRPSLGPAARRRWRAYGRLATAAGRRLDAHGSLHVLTLGVALAARRRGVARRLLEAVVRDERWCEHVRHLRVETWHEQNVAIYEALGFAVAAHAQRDGVHCWTMLRPTRSAP